MSSGQRNHRFTWGMRGNRDSSRLSGKPSGRRLYRHRYGIKRPVETLAGLEAVQPGACEERRLA